MLTFLRKRCVMATANQAERAPEPCRWPTVESLEEKLRGARHTVTTARHVAGDAVTDLVLDIRRHPLRAVGAAAVVGAAAGVLVGFGAGWFARKRR